MDNNFYNNLHRANELWEELGTRAHAVQLLFQKMSSDIAYTQLAFGMGYMPMEMRLRLMDNFRHESDKCGEKLNEITNEYLRNKAISSIAESLSRNRRGYYLDY